MLCFISCSTGGLLSHVAGDGMFQIACSQKILARGIVYLRSKGMNKVLQFFYIIFLTLDFLVFRRLMKLKDMNSMVNV
jgi:hypothetical protein